MSKRIIGILGGMGPAATVELFHRIVGYTNAASDQEHVNMVIINDPQIPDRTKYLFGESESPVPRLIENLNKLQVSGAEIAAMPCMTAHSFLPELQKESPIPMINAIALIESYLQEFYPQVNKIGLLATDGSLKSGVYNKYLTKKIYIPDPDDQNKIMDIIYAIKSGNTSIEITLQIKDVVDNLRSRGIEAVTLK